MVPPLPKDELAAKEKEYDELEIASDKALDDAEKRIAGENAARIAELEGTVAELTQGQADTEAYYTTELENMQYETQRQNDEWQVTFDTATAKWEELKDEKGTTYYHNPVSGEDVWDDPNPPSEREVEVTRKMNEYKMKMDKLQMDNRKGEVSFQEDKKKLNRLTADHKRLNKKHDKLVEEKEAFDKASQGQIENLDAALEDTTMRLESWLMLYEEEALRHRLDAEGRQEEKEATAAAFAQHKRDAVQVCCSYITLCIGILCLI